MPSTRGGVGALAYARPVAQPRFLTVQTTPDDAEFSSSFGFSSITFQHATGSISGKAIRPSIFRSFEIGQKRPFGTASGGYNFLLLA